MASPENEEDLDMLSLTNRNYKDCIPPARRFMAPRRDRKMGYGIPLTHQNVRWSQFFVDYMENLPKEKTTEDYIKLAPLASSAARMMCARASMIWEPSELHLGSTGDALCYTCLALFLAIYFVSTL